MKENLLQVGQIVRSHGVKGDVKIQSFLDKDFNCLKHIFIGEKLESANITHISSLNNNAFSVGIDIIKDIDTANRYKNQYIYIDRLEYAKFQDKVYLSDLIGQPVKNELDEVVGELVDYDEYGASTILTIKCGAVSYQLPFVDSIINYNKEKKSLVVDEKTFEDVRI